MQGVQYAEDYKIHCLLGDGGQANVYLGSKGLQLYAIKVYLPGASKEAAYKIEVDLLKKLSFPHLINIVDHFPHAKVKLHNKSEELRPVMVLELAEGGELFDFLSKQGRFKPEVCRTFTKQLVSSIKYLADVGVSHRDLKPQNILFDSQFRVKVSDFGLSRDALGDNKDFKLYSKLGTEGYKPPEMEQGNYTGIQADLFATGVVLFLMYNGTPPFLSTKPHDKIYKLIRDKNFVKFWSLHERSKPPGFYPDSFKRLMNSFFSAEPDRRPTFESLNDDEWLKSDELMLNEVRDYMQAKYDKIAETDLTKKKIAAAKKEICLKQAMEEQCCDDEDRGESEFLTYYGEFNIKEQDLPEFTKKKVVYVPQKPAFLLAWIKDSLREQISNKESFIEDYTGNLVPEEFGLTYNNQEQLVDLRLLFNVGEGEEEEQVELELKGRLHRGEKGVGIDWERVKGHPFWLATVEGKINETLQTIA